MVPSRPTPRWLLAGKALLAGLPPLILLALVLHFGVDVPFQDQWEAFCPLLEKADAGTLRLGDFFALHNEHRHAFPRLLLFALAQLTQWNVRAELVLNVGLLALAAVNVVVLARRSGVTLAGGTGWMLVAASALLFTPQQHENLLWGFQAVFLLTLVWLTALLWMVPASRPAVAFGLGALFPFLGTYSMAGGLLLWPLAAVLLACHAGANTWPARRTAWSLWSLVGIASVAAYWIGYARPEHHPSLLAALREPWTLLRHALITLGAPFGSGSRTLSTVLGAILVAVFVACAIGVFRVRRDRVRFDRGVPWLLLAAFAFGHAAMTALGRSPFGPGSALASRYVSISVLAPIGLMFTAAALCAADDSQPRTRGRRARLATALTGAGLLAALFAASIVHTFPAWAYMRTTRLRARAAVQLHEIEGSALLLTSATHVPPALIRTGADRPTARRREDPADLARAVAENGAWMRGRIRFLASTGRLRPLPVPRDGIARIAAPGPADPATGLIQWFHPTDGTAVVLAGWARLAREERGADAVLITYDNTAGEPVALAAVAAHVVRPAAPDGRATEPFPGSSWVVTIPLHALPPHPTTLRAWAYDAASMLAHPLASTIPPEAVRQVRQRVSP